MARRRGGLLAPASSAQVDELEATFAASPGFGAADAVAPTAHFQFVQDPTPTLPTLAVRGGILLGEPGSALSPVSAIEFAPAPTSAPRRRFIAWSRRYVVALGAADVMTGALGAAIPAQFSANLDHRLALVSLLALLGAVIWPVSIGLARGYARSRVGIGSDELRAVLRAGVGVVVAGAFPAGLLGQQTLLTLVVVGVPFAVLLSTCTRFVARKVLHLARARASTCATLSWWVRRPPPASCVSAWIARHIAA